MGADGVWDRLAGDYDRQLQRELTAVRAALELASPQPDELLLDVGTGTGAVLREAARRSPRPEHALGVDPSAEMLIEVPPLPRGWKLKRARISRLPVPDSSVDVATAAYVLHVLEPDERARGLAELGRVLRPGGRLVCVTPWVARRGLGRAGAFALDAVARIAPERLGGMRTFDPRPELQRAGFRVAQARTTRGGYPSLCVSSVTMPAWRPAP